MRPLAVPRTLAALLLLVSALVLLVGAQSSLTTNGVVSLTSDISAAGQAAIIDGNDATFWQSGASFPYGYIDRADLNVLLGLCATSSACTASAGSSAGLAGVTDGDTSTYSPQIAAPAGGLASLHLQLPGGPVTLRRVSLRPIVGNAPINITLQRTAAAGGPVAIGTFNSSTSYQWIASLGPWDGVTAIQLTSTTSFILTEIAATCVPNFEQATVDMGSRQTLGSIRWGGQHQLGWAGVRAATCGRLHAPQGR